MELTKEDVFLIENNSSYIKEKFSYVDKDGYLVLKKVGNRCIFLSKEKPLSCEIYPYRPQGCRFYPMMFDISKQKCVLDDDCPHKSKFYRKTEEFKISCNKLKTWVEKHF